MVEPGEAKTRTLTLIAVVVLHVAMVALFVLSTRRLDRGASAEHLIEVTLLPPHPVPRIRIDAIKRERLRSDVAVASAPPLLNSSVQSGAGAAPDGRGAAVNWTAEARRALRAFEIRRDQLPSRARSVSPPPDEWWRLEHHAGDQYKTDSGDWIVWVSANCYQVASWHSMERDGGAGPTICRHPNVVKHE